MNFAVAVAIAVQFWTSRGVEVPCSPHPVTGPPADAVLIPFGTGGWPADMGTVASTCTIYISSTASGNRSRLPATYCMEVAHEVGHLAGLQHDNDPKSIMYGEGIDDTYAPWNCWHAKTFSRRLKLRSATSP